MSLFYACSDYPNFGKVELITTVLQISFTGEINVVNSIWLDISFQAFTTAVAQMTHSGFLHHAESYTM